MAGTAQLHVTGLRVGRGDRRLLDDVTLSVGPGDRIGLTGPNGAGKSTLLSVLVGEITPDAGVRQTTPTDATVGLLGQEVEALGDESARIWLERVLGIADASRTLDAATQAIAVGDDDAASADRYDVALRRWLALGGATFDERIGPALDTVGLGEDRLDLPVVALSGGQRAKLGLAAVLASSFDVLLLDEPTNDLDLDGLAVLERVLGSMDVPFVLVSHDRRLLERTVETVWEIDPFRSSIARYGGGWEGFLRERAVAREQEERAYHDYETKRDDLLARARTERSWAVKGANRAARKPVDNDKTLRNLKIEQSENLAAKARRTERAIERLEEVDKPWVPWRLQFDFGTAARSGDVVVTFDDVVLRRGTFELGPVDLDVRAGERLRIAGPNGSGKSTLLRAMLGELEPSHGTIRIGPSVTLGVLDQMRTLRGTPVEAVVERTGATTEEVRSTLAKFGLDADAVHRSIDSLSPGERTRTMLATFQIRGVNTVVLDEPTNHLDLEAIEQLESALERFDGTLLVVSHDRTFVEALAIHRTVELA